MFSVTYLQEDGISDQNRGHRQTMGYDTSGSRREDNKYRLSKVQLYVWGCKLC